MQIVSGVGDFVSDLNGLRGAVTGNITLSCSFGFGHEYMADALSGLMNLHNGLNVKLMLSDREVNLVDEGSTSRSTSAMKSTISISPGSWRLTAGSCAPHRTICVRLAYRHRWMICDSMTA